ncbi:MAG: TonB-dependent receptor [Pirellulaceae bacterium]|nr:TonB-dependent receptor [Pirellulaceae bacterium]
MTNRAKPPEPQSPSTCRSNSRPKSHARPSEWIVGFRGADVGYGFELAAGYTLNERWKLRGAYSFLIMCLRPLDPDAELAFLPGENPRNQFHLWLSGNLGNDWQVDFIGRYVDTLEALDVPRYFVMDVRLAWRPSERLELYVAGRHLLDSSHLEFGSGSVLSQFDTQVKQEFLGGLSWRF